MRQHSTPNDSLKRTIVAGFLRNPGSGWLEAGRSHHERFPLHGRASADGIAHRRDQKNSGMLAPTAAGLAAVSGLNDLRGMRLNARDGDLLHRIATNDRDSEKPCYTAIERTLGGAGGAGL